jgi:GAF domain-containing protein
MAAGQDLAGRVREALEPLGESPDAREALMAALAAISEASGCESVGIRWKAGEDYPYYLTRGFGIDFVVREGPLCDRDSAGLIVRHRDGTPQLACMCGAVIQGRTDPSQPYFTEAGSFWTNGTTLLVQRLPQGIAAVKPRNYCNAAGYESVALIPLRAGGETYGLLQLDSRSPDRFTREQIERYEQVAGEIARALSAHLAGD